MHRVLNAGRTARRVAEPGRALIESRLDEWRRLADGGDQGAASIGAKELTETLGSMLPQQRAELVVATLTELTLRIGEAEERAELSVLGQATKRALGELEKQIGGFPPKLQARALEQLETFRTGTVGPRGLITLREAELGALDQARSILENNAGISERLTAAVDALVTNAQQSIVEANLAARNVRSFGSSVLIAVVASSLVSSALIVWLYVHRNLLRRLTALSGSMLAVAGGNLRVPLPPSNGLDEIAGMARALTLFRDTAIEIEEKGLREIEHARQRLIDALESTSEGFAFYGPDDRLELCNSRYKELLYGGTELKIEPGITFERIVRRAVEHGLIEDARTDPEAYVQQRLQQHLSPGEPTLQQRSDGRWILIAERRIAWGGTVAVYSDLTALKQRELELEQAHLRTTAAAAEIERKNAELMVLSSKLAKYLSPQVYDSIFSGRQAVEIASQRKKLTIFFSDIAGFAEKTDVMESEDLTQLLHHYLTEMSRIALEHGATIDKYIGDAIMVFFGDPETRGAREDALACVRMAIRMQERMRELAIMWRDSGIVQPLQCRIGIHTGYCTVGNFGGEDRMDYTIIGGAVNLAARLEQEAPPGGILISYETHALVKEAIACEATGSLRLRGIGRPVLAYRVVGAQTDASAAAAPVHADLPHLRLDLDAAEMSAEERRLAATMLAEAMRRLDGHAEVESPPGVERATRAAE
jgi:class 3 adenylate cyclase